MSTHMTKVKAVLGVCFLIIFFLTTDGVAADTTGVTENEVRIGVFQSITGPAAGIGTPLMESFVTIVNLTNEAGGVHGRKIKALIEDDGNNPERAKSAVKKLIFNDKVFALQGSGSSLAAFAVKKDIEEAKVPWMVGSCVMDKVYQPASPTTYGYGPTASSLGRVMLKFTLGMPNIRKIAVIYHYDEWGNAHIDPIVKEVEKHKNLELTTEVVDRGIIDASPAVLRIKKFNPDIVLVVLYLQECSVFVRDAYKYGLKVPIVLSAAATDIRDVRDRTGIPESMKSVFVPVATTISPSTLSEPRYSELTIPLKQYFPQARIQNLDAYGFSYGRIIVEALKRSGRELTREKFLDVMDNLRDFDTKVRVGKVSYSKTNHMPDIDYVFLSLRKDGIEYYTEKSEWDPDIMKKRGWE